MSRQSSDQTPPPRIIENVDFLERENRRDNRSRRHSRSSSGGPSPPPQSVPLLSQSERYSYGYGPGYQYSYAAAPPGPLPPPQYYPLYQQYSQQPHQPYPQQQGPPPPPTYAFPMPPAMPAPYPPSPRASDSSSIAPPMESAALSMDDIEQAFHSALMAQQFHPLNDTVSREHPLKRDSPLWLQRGDLAEERPLLQRSPSQSSLQKALSSTGTGGGYGALSSVYKSRAPPPPSPRHRRANSDTPLRASHHRTGSLSSNVERRTNWKEQLSAPRTARLKTDPLRSRKRFDGPRSYTDTNRLRTVSSGGSGKPPQHRRGGSLGAGSSFGGSVAGESVATDASMFSVVSDIRKSRFFAGYHESGHAKLSFPISQVHLVMDKSLVSGRFYQVPVDTEIYEDYHLSAEDLSLGFEGTHACGCPCSHCAGCRGKHELLPPSYYAIAVEDDLYRRVLDEICESRSMPCGLFFCGHHEDVSRPSILLAVLPIVSLLGTMGYLAYAMQS